MGREEAVFGGSVAADAGVGWGGGSSAAASVGLLPPWVSPSGHEAPLLPPRAWPCPTAPKKGWAWPQGEWMWVEAPPFRTPRRRASQLRLRVLVWAPQAVTQWGSLCSRRQSMVASS